MSHLPAQIEIDGQLYERIGVEDFDRDSLHTLPLSVVPIRLPTLRKAKLVKTVRLDVAIELFSGGGTGSGLLNVGDVEKHFNLPPSPQHPDVALLNKLATLPSFDVYSLRILLREANITVTDKSALKLSPARVATLNTYMMTFTRPLVTAIFGNTDSSMSSFEDVLGILRNPDVKKVRERLTQIASTLSLEMMEIPKFLEDFADISLSLSYYRQCLDSIMPAIDSFLAATKELKGNFQLKNDNNLMGNVVAIEKVINALLINISGRFESFDRSTNDLWQKSERRTVSQGRSIDQELSHQYRRRVMRAQRQNGCVAEIVSQSECRGTNAPRRVRHVRNEAGHRADQGDQERGPRRGRASLGEPERWICIPKTQ